MPRYLSFRQQQQGAEAPEMQKKILLCFRGGEEELISFLKDDRCDSRGRRIKILAKVGDNIRENLTVHQVENGDKELDHKEL